jgi:integrase
MSKSGDNRRIHGSGSLFQREDGMWVAAVLNPINKKQIRRYAKTKGKAEAHLREMLNNLADGLTPISKNITVSDYAEIWINERAGLRRKAVSVREYKRRLRIHVLPHIGHKRLSAVTVRDIELLLNVCKNGGAAKRMVEGVKNTISAMYADALRDRDVTYNPVRDARIPVMQHKPRKKYPTDEEVTALFVAGRALDGDSQQELVRVLVILAITGCRIGEVLAMKWADLDLDEGVWTISQTATINEAGHVVIGDSTKTSQLRDLPLHPDALTCIKHQQEYLAYRRARMKVWDENNLVFPSRFGTVRDERNYLTYLNKVIPSWGHTFHDLRHWFATSLLNQGVSDVVIAKVLGHSSTRTTRDVYGHAMPSAINQISNKVSKIIGQ